MSKMSGEKDRWEYQVAEIQRDAALLSTHTCLSAAYCTYLGHFSEDVRQQAGENGARFHGRRPRSSHILVS